MSNNITKTETLVEMKSAYKKDNDVGEGRSLRSRRVNYIINKKQQQKRK